MSTTSLKLPLHVMPADQARAETARAASQRLQALSALIWRGLVAIGEARGRSAMQQAAEGVAFSQPALAASLLDAAQKRTRG